MFRTAAVAILSALALASCQSAPIVNADLQTVVENLAAQNPDIVRLTVHRVPDGHGKMYAVASTSAEKLGRPSDPEDHEAIAEGRSIVLDEGPAIDVSVPILEQDGAFTAVAGVTLQASDRAAAVTKAEIIARSIEAGMRM